MSLISFHFVISLKISSAGAVPDRRFGIFSQFPRWKAFLRKNPLHPPGTVGTALHTSGSSAPVPVQRHGTVSVRPRPPHKSELPVPNRSKPDFPVGFQRPHQQIATVCQIHLPSHVYRKIIPDSMHCLIRTQLDYPARFLQPGQPCFVCKK